MVRATLQHLTTEEEESTAPVQCHRALNQKHSCPHQSVTCRRMCSSVSSGVAAGLAPQLTIEGTGGAYVMRDARRAPVAVFKPTDEEAFAPHNPRGFVGPLGGPGFHPGVPSGECAVREVAAFAADVDALCGVPETTLVSIAHPALNNPPHCTPPKKGSLQQWLTADGTVGDWSPSKFDSEQIERVALLDMRLLNTDRNEGNLLVVATEGGLQLRPIDHGGCLPAVSRVGPDSWCWLNWPALKSKPSRACLEYMNNLNVDNLTTELEQLGIKHDSLWLMHAAHAVILEGLEAGCTLYDIATILCRRQEEEQSCFELICKEWYLETSIASTLQHTPCYSSSRCGAFRCNSQLQQGREGCRPLPTSLFGDPPCSSHPFIRHVHKRTKAYLEASHKPTSTENS